MSQSKPLTAHQLAKYLLDLPDFPILLADDHDDLRDGYGETITIDSIGVVRYQKDQDEQGEHNYIVEDLEENDLHPKMDCKNIFIVLYPSA